MTAPYCHSDGDLGRQIAAYRPRGDAWRHGGDDAIDGSVMGQVFAAFGAAMGPTERRLCALIDEFFCSTAVETRDLWALDYGVPDGCDPFADLCEKVNAVGDSTPAYVEGAALRRGWSISITQEWIVSTQSCVMGAGQMGAIHMGAQQGVAWRIAVDLSASPTYAAAAVQPLMGLTQLGLGFNCPPDIEALRCLVRRIAPAHADLIFTTV